MTEAEIAWLAGIIDGEGCISITKTLAGSRNRPCATNDYHRLRVHVTMGHEPTVRRIQSLTGLGSVTLRRMSKYGNYNDAYQWQAFNRETEKFLRIVQPYIFTKAEELSTALEFTETIAPRCHRYGTPLEVLKKREELFQRMRDLKPRNTVKRNTLSTDSHS